MNRNPLAMTLQTELEQIKGSVQDSVWTPQVTYETPEEGQKKYRPKRCDYNNEDEVDNPNIICIFISRPKIFKQDREDGSIF